jgi:hypothetical protein
MHQKLELVARRCSHYAQGKGNVAVCLLPFPLVNAAYAVCTAPPPLEIHLKRLHAPTPPMPRDTTASIPIPNFSFSALAPELRVTIYSYFLRRGNRESFYVRSRKADEEPARCEPSCFSSIFRPPREAPKYMSTTAKYYDMYGSLIACEWQDSSCIGDLGMFLFYFGIIGSYLVGALIFICVIAYVVWNPITSILLHTLNVCVF